MQPSFNEFKEEWLKDITEGNPSTTELGYKFVLKITLQWLDIDENYDTDNFYYIDGCGDGGVDIAYLEQGENEDSGNTWYIIQGKYGSSYNGKNTLLEESKKLLSTLSGENTNLSNKAALAIGKLKEFVKNAGDNDKLILVFATCDEMPDDEFLLLKEIRELGVEKLGKIFKTEAVSIKSIYNNVIEKTQEKYDFLLEANLSQSSDILLIGSIKILDVYKFLNEYKDKTKDLDLIYEKNVRKYLGSKGKINKGIKDTIINKPERFGLYNNGITIVVEKFILKENNKWILTEPYIVNGCQTTRTIWETLEVKLSNGSTNKKNDNDDWKNKLEKACVVVKVVKINEEDNSLLNETTQYTNRQNSVPDKDFIALDEDFRNWHNEFKKKYNVYLEIQKGAWDSFKAKQNKNTNLNKITKRVSATELLKIYAAGWLERPGDAFGKNPPFAPGGTVFKEVTSKDSKFGINDLYSCYILFEIINKQENKQKLGKARFLLCFVFIRLLRSFVAQDKSLAEVIIKLHDKDTLKILETNALSCIEDYMNKNNEDSMHKEPSFPKDGDLNAFLKTNKFKEKIECPKLSDCIDLQKKHMAKEKQKEIILKILDEE